MAISFLKRKPLFNDEQQKRIVTAIQQAEQCTSGEIRVYVENHCRYVNPLDRAAEIFSGLRMEKTAARNAVLVYVALKDRQLALYGDKGIHEKVGDTFWNAQIRLILSHFSRENYAEGIAGVVGEIGEA